MKHSFLVLLLLFFVMHSQVQGVRLGKSLLATLQVQHGRVHNVAVDSNINPGNGSDHAEVEVACKNRRCTKAGNHTKPIPTSSSSTSISTTNEENESNNGNNPNSKLMHEAIDKKFDGQEKNFAVESPTAAASNHRNESPEHLPDIIDIAGMDYSPAKRKPPIHN